MITSIKEYESTQCLLCIHGYYTEVNVRSIIENDIFVRPFRCYYPSSYLDSMDRVAIFKVPSKTINEHTIASCILGNWYNIEWHDPN